MHDERKEICQPSVPSKTCESVHAPITYVKDDGFEWLNIISQSTTTVSMNGNVSFEKEKNKEMPMDL
jgi:hypothetical protein